MKVPAAGQVAVDWVLACLVAMKSWTAAKFFDGQWGRSCSFHWASLAWGDGHDVRLVDDETMKVVVQCTGCWMESRCGRSGLKP
jgi:hypothetical protein